MRKSNSKSNFTKNRWASLFSCGRLKISNSPDLASAQKVRLHHWRYFGYLSYQYSRKLKSFPIFSWKRWYHILRIIRVMQLNHWNLWSVFFLKIWKLLIIWAVSPIWLTKKVGCLRKFLIVCQRLLNEKVI